MSEKIMLVMVLTERRSNIEYYNVLRYTRRQNLGERGFLVRKLGEVNLGEEFV